LTLCSHGNIISPMVIGEHLTTKDAAERLGYTVQHVRRLIREGRLRGSRVGRDWLVARDSVDRYVADRETLKLPIKE